MHGTSQVRGRGRNAPIHMDGYEEERHRGGTTPPKRLEAKLLETPSRPRVVAVTAKDGMRQFVTITGPKGNA